MSIFSGIELVHAEGLSNKQYFEPGKYKVEIERVFIHEKRLGGTKLFIAETKIIESDNDNIKIGHQRNWVQSLATPYALPRIKTFIGVAMGLCPLGQLKDINKAVTTEVSNHAVSDKNPLKGKILSLQCANKITKNGKNFTTCEWRLSNG